MASDYRDFGMLKSWIIFDEPAHNDRHYVIFVKRYDVALTHWYRSLIERGEQPPCSLQPRLCLFVPDKYDWNGVVGRLQTIFQRLFYAGQSMLAIKCKDDFATIKPKKSHTVGQRIRYFGDYFGVAIRTEISNFQPIRCAAIGCQNE